MSNNTWFIGDTHFGHQNILTFMTYEGEKLRDFSSIEEHDETIIENWNKVVKPYDKVYHLGDAIMNVKNLHIFDRLLGKKRLVRGNHDMGNTSLYMKYFDEVYSCRIIDKMLFTHIPIHPDCLARWKANIHGHLHSNHILLPSGERDSRYLNVSCEQINFTPISLEEIKVILAEQKNIHYSLTI